MADTAGGVERVDLAGAGFAGGRGQFQPVIGFVDGEAVERGLVEIVEHLADHAAAFDAHAFELAIGERGVDQGGHVILGRL